MPQRYTGQQLTGSEYGGVERTTASIQPKPAEALNNGEKLRLGYLNGRPDDTEALEDRRQFWGLKPASDRRPYWLDNTGDISEAEARQVGERGD